MRRTPYLAILFAIALGFSMLTSCGDLNSIITTENNPNASTSAPAPAPAAAPSSISQGLQTASTNLQTAKSNFDESLRKYLDGLSVIAQIPETEREPQILETFDYTTPMQKLDAVADAANKFPKPTNSTQKNQADESLEQVNMTVKEIRDKVLAPLQNGGVSNPEAVKQVQVSLEMKIDQDNIGRYGITTYDNILSFLNERQTKLTAQVENLNQLVDEPHSPNPSSLGEDPNSGSQEDWLTQANWFEWIIVLILGVVVVFGVTLLPPRPRNSKSSSLLEKGGISNPESRINQSNISISSDRFQKLENRVRQLESEQQPKATHRQQENRISASQYDTGDLWTQIELIKQQIEKIQDYKGQQFGQSAYYPHSPSVAPVTRSQREEPRGNRTPPLPNPTSPMFTCHKTVEQSLVDLYNQNLSKLKEGYGTKTVSIPIDAQGSLWVGKTEAAALKEDRQGNYWVIEDGGNSYLVPKGEIRLNSSSLESLAVLYDFENQADVDRPLKLTKVAVVSRLSGSEGWQLKEKGSLRFGEY